MTPQRAIEGHKKTRVIQGQKAIQGQYYKIPVIYMLELEEYIFDPLRDIQWIYLGILSRSILLYRINNIEQTLAALQI